MIEELWKEYSKDGSLEAREKLIMACLPYVKASAYRLVMYATSSQDADDLVNAGIIGLMDALERYDPAKGASFKNYAKYRVRGSIMDEIRSMDWVPYSTRDKARKIERTMQELGENADKLPDEEDMATAMGISLQRYHETLQEVSRMTLSLLEDTFYDGDVSNPPESISVQGPEEDLVHSETVDAVGNAIENLPEKERLVVTLYYYEEMTMKEIGQVLDISESRVCQIHSSAILRLHTRLKYVSADANV
ncbi:sigma-70 family RNA polymerase sigma factor [Candidatus Poribacteria bacterium]